MQCDAIKDDFLDIRREILLAHHSGALKTWQYRESSISVFPIQVYKASHCPLKATSHHSPTVLTFIFSTLNYSFKMRFTLNVLSVGVLAALGANAAPADNAGSAATGFVTPSSDSTMKLRESEPQVIMYADDACGDHLGEFALRAGSRTCVPVSRTGGSIRVPGK